jgi:hypothetical protein
MTLFGSFAIRRLTSRYRGMDPFAYDPPSVYPNDEWTAETVGSAAGSQHNSPGMLLGDETETL